MREADIGFGNCEQVIASVGFYAQRMAYPPMLDDFKAVGLNALGLANNHFMDMGPMPGDAGPRGDARPGHPVRRLRPEPRGSPGAGNPGGEGRARRADVVLVLGRHFAPPAYMEQARAGANKPGLAMIVGHQVAVPGTDTTVLMPAAADMRMLADSVARAEDAGGLPDGVVPPALGRSGRHRPGDHPAAAPGTPDVDHPGRSQRRPQPRQRRPQADLPRRGGRRAPTSSSATATTC